MLDTTCKFDTRFVAARTASEFAEIAASSPFQELFFWNDINLLDTIFTPLYLTCLQLARQQTADSRRWLRLRNTAYRLRIALRQKMATWLAPTIRPAEALFWPCEPTHIGAMMPVANEPRMVGSRVFLASDARTFFQLRQRNQTAIFVDATWSEPLNAVVRAKRSQIGDGATLRQWVKSSLSKQARNSEDYCQTISILLQASLPLAAKAVAAAELAFQQIEPRTVVVGNDLTTQGRAACLVAKQFGVNSVCPSHGRVTGDANQAYHIADHLAVYGESQRQTLISCGITSARIDVVGAPYLDTLPPQGHQMHPAISARLKVPANMPWVLVALSGAGHLVSHSHHQQTIANLFAACQQLPHLHFVVKLHRKDRPFHYRNCPTNIRERFHVISNNTRGFPSSIFDWLQGPRALLTGASQVAVESMLMQVPVITMDFANELGDTDFIQQQATIHVQTTEQLVRAVKSVIATPDAYATTRDRARQFVEREFYKLDGQASARAAELIVNSISRTADLPA